MCIRDREYLVPKGKHIHLQDGDLIEKGDYIVDGNPAPHDILAIKGVEELAGYLVNEIQEVYRLQGVAINDKPVSYTHLDVYKRQGACHHRFRHGRRLTRNPHPGPHHG